MNSSRICHNDYLIKNVYQSFLLVSILGALAATAGMLIDNVIVGQFLGADALGAMAVVTPVSFVFSVFSNICSGGGTVKVAYALGKGDRKEVNNAFTVTIIIVVVSSLVITAVGLMFTPQIVSLLGGGEDTEISRLSVQYLRGFFIGTLPTVMLPPLSGFARLDGSAKLPLLAMITMSVGDILFDLVSTLIFHGGMFGMAIATSASYVLAVLVLLTHFRKKNRMLHLVKPLRTLSEIGSTVAAGAPMALSRACDTIKLTGLLRLAMLVAGASAVTAFGVRNQAENIISALAVGVGQALVPIAGVFYGEEDRAALKDSLRSAIKAGVAINLAAAAVILAFPGIFTRMLGVSDKPEIVEISFVALRLFALSLPFKTLNTILMNFYQSTKRSMKANGICLMQSLVYPLLAAVILSRSMGASGIWLAFLLAEILTLCTTLILISVRNHRPFSGLDDAMQLGDEFGSGREDSLEISIPNSMEDIIRVSSGISKFAKNRDISDRIMGRVSLCIEEIVGNIVRHSYKEGEKRFVDLLLVNKPECVIVQFRDNGSVFDPPAFLQEMQTSGTAGEGEKNIGLRLIASLADDMKYQYHIGLNNLTIRFDKKTELK